MATVEQSLPQGLSIFGPKFERGERLNPSLVAHRENRSMGVYVDTHNRYVPRTVFERWKNWGNKSNR